MRISSVREFRDNASGMLRATDSDSGHAPGRLAGIFFPGPDATLPVELKREMFGILSAGIGLQLRKPGVSEEEVLADFAAWRKAKRAANRTRI